jgi:hypothetical protein
LFAGGDTRFWLGRKANDYPQAITRKQESASANLKINWHPEPGVVAAAISINNMNVRLTQERWIHITEYHRELTNFQLEILLTVAEPDSVYFSPIDAKSSFAAVKTFGRLADFGLAKNLTVHYKEPSGSSGFILTTFVLSDKRLKKRFKLWQRLK